MIDGTKAILRRHEMLAAYKEIGSYAGVARHYNLSISSVTGKIRYAAREADEGRAPMPDRVSWLGTRIYRVIELAAGKPAGQITASDVAAISPSRLVGSGNFGRKSLLDVAEWIRGEGAALPPEWSNLPLELKQERDVLTFPCPHCGEGISVSAFAREARAHAKVIAGGQEEQDG